MKICESFNKIYFIKTPNKISQYKWVLKGTVEV